MSFWAGMLLASAQPAETPADCSFDPPLPDHVAIQRALPHLCGFYSFPPGVAQIPALETWLRRDADRLESEASARVREALAQPPEGRDAADLPSHGFDQRWSVAADSPALFVLIGFASTYEGGAHGALSYRTMFWDRAQGRPIAFSDIFSDAPAVYRLLQQSFCPRLLAMQEERGYTAEEALPCPDLEDHRVVLLGANGQIIGLQALFAPYVAGSYAEGPYEVDLPLTQELVRLVRPEFRGDFAPTE